MNNKHKNHKSAPARKYYLLLLVMAILSFISMYILMYAMVNTFDNIFNNLNQVYMAALMTAPMVLIEISLMRSMYKIKKANAIIIAISVIVLLSSFAFIRQQTAIGDQEFLRSMIPHHSAAILMCEQAKIENPEIKELCDQIIQNQQEEIDQMKAMLNEAPPEPLPATMILLVVVGIVLVACATLFVYFRKNEQ